MPKIILASRSKARKRLLREYGIKFETDASAVIESKTLKKGCAALVMKNAVRKAADVADRYISGVIIAADTIVLSGKKVIGKPRNMKDAFNTLKLLSRNPQWIYTGIAVIDIDKGRRFFDYAKTKVYMRRMTDRQIWNYFKRVSPLDKAGSFNIQGLGGRFIERIEGPFDNVVGLPMAKLIPILKKVKGLV